VADQPPPTRTLIAGGPTNGVRSRGFATEAGHEWIRYGFEEIGLESIVSIYEPANIASGAVMRCLGFRLDRETTHPALGVGLHVMSLSKSAWHSR